MPQLAVIIQKILSTASYHHGQVEEEPEGPGKRCGKVSSVAKKGNQFPLIFISQMRSPRCSILTTSYYCWSLPKLNNHLNNLFPNLCQRSKICKFSYRVVLLCFVLLHQGHLYYFFCIYSFLVKVMLNRPR